jgi:hypothetical protein
MRSFIQKIAIAGILSLPFPLAAEDMTSASPLEPTEGNPSPMYFEKARDPESGAALIDEYGNDQILSYTNTQAVHYEKPPAENLVNSADGQSAEDLNGEAAMERIDTNKLSGGGAR